MSISKDSLTGILCVIGAGMCWGTTGTIQAFMPAAATSLVVGSARVVFSGVILLAAMAVKTRGKIFFGKWSVKGVLLAAFGLAGYQLTFFSAVKMTGVAAGTMVAIGSAPPIAGIFGWLLFRERLGWRWLAATAATVAGCVMLILGGGGEISVSFAGVLLALCAAVSYALEGVGLRYVRRSPYETIAMVSAASGLMALPWFLAGDLSWMLLPRGALCITLLVFVSTIIPYTLFTIGIRKIKLGTGYTLALSEPLTAWFLSTALLGERLSAVGVAGVGTLFAGILLLALDKKAA
ncbi:DMT family transporter [Synergistes jonesii]|uniref:DMT family transporter n=1 Tax=Synergistes jonesii TaxID=2754 RepID=UPI00248D9A15|nr:DMT family transporter [Synergistes jonesii]